MFATQHYMEMTPDHKKRPRDDPAEDGSREEEHRNVSLYVIAPDDAIADRQ